MTLFTTGKSFNDSLRVLHLVSLLYLFSDWLYFWLLFLGLAAPQIILGKM